MKPTLALVCLTACSLARAQPPAPAAQPAEPGPQAYAPQVITTRSALVLVPALVRTKRGDLVFTLTSSDFYLTDDGVAQNVTLEADTGGEPLALVVLIQTGGAGGRELDKYRNLASMIDTMVGDVPRTIAVVGFDSDPTLAQDFTPDPEPVATAIHDLGPGDKGAAILDALAFSLDLLRKQPPEYRRAILLLSETEDHGSRVKLEDALRTVSDTNTAIYSVAFSSTKAVLKHESKKMISSDPTPGPPGGCMSKDPNSDPATEESTLDQTWDCLTLLAPPLRLIKMIEAASKALGRNVPETVARLTGGEYFKLGDEKGLERSLETLSNHLPNRYILSFHPQSPHPGLHALRLQLPNHANLEVTARNSYWAEPAP
jgi:VWFA-related protein